MTCLICLERDPMVSYSVCGRCKVNLANSLAEILTLYALTEDELSPGSGTGRGTERPIGLRVTALNALAGHDLLAVLGSWETDWRETFDLAPPPTRWRSDRTGRALRVLPVQATLAEIVEFLLVWLDHACKATVYGATPAEPACPFGRWGRAGRGPWVDWDPCLPTGMRDGTDIGEFAKDVRLIHGQLRVAARVQTPATYRVPCPADHGHGDCGHMLRVNPDLDELVDCQACGTTWTTRRLLLVAAADSASEIWLDVAAMAEMSGMPERTLRDWAQRGLVAREHGRYSLGSVQAAMMGDVG